MKCPWEEDPLICDLMDSKGKRVEIVAFGIVYTGVLEEVDLENGFIILTDGDNKAALEVERIESFCRLP